MTHEFDVGWEAAYAQHDTAGLWSEEPVPCVDAVIEQLAKRDCRSVLDIGCGDGRNLLRFVEAGFLCAGLDISSTGLRLAARRLAGRAFLIHSDASSLSAIADDSVDAITCLDVFGQIPDPQAMIQSYARVLRPGGIVALNAFTPQDSEYGKGIEVDRHTFNYKGTLFRFFDEEDMRHLFASWEVNELYRQSWDDPPHGEFRPYEHTHDNWILIASIVHSDARKATVS